MFSHVFSLAEHIHSSVYCGLCSVLRFTLHYSQLSLENGIFCFQNMNRKVTCGPCHIVFVVSLDEYLPV
jgi:hypothetical protein